MHLAGAGGAGTSWQQPALVAAAFLQWAALAHLALWGVERRDLRWILPAIGISVIATAAGDGSRGFGLLAIPALVRARWRYELRGSERWLLGFLAAIYFLSHGISINDFRPHLPDPTLGGGGRFAAWVDSLGAMYALLSLRHVRRAQLRIRSIRRRLVVSHLLAGAVPVALLLAFWFLSAYLTMCNDKAAVAVRMMEQDAVELRAALAGTADPEEAGRTLARLGARYIAPGPGGPPWTAQWGEELPQAAVAWIEGEAWLAARDAGRGIALRPLAPLLASRYEPAAGARLALAANMRVSTNERGVQIGPETVDEDSTAAPGESRHAGSDIRGGPGASLVRILEFSPAGGRTDDVLLLARAGFVESLIGSVRGVRENPVSFFYLVVLGIVALTLLGVELYAAGMVSRMARSIAGAIASLRRGTEELEAGRLEHRIPIEGRDDLWDVAASFNQMAKGLQRAQSLELERERMEGELRLARQIQSRLLPAGPPSVVRLDLAGTYLPAQEVGGDYYGYLAAGEGRIGLVIADVAGKGIPAALLMSGFRASLLSQMLDRLDPGSALARVNDFLLQGIDPGRFVTAFLAVLDPAAGRLRYAGAGHNPPLLLRAGGGIERLEQGGLMLGVLEGLSYPTAETRFLPGDLLVLYTDGVTEAQNDAGELWGEERLVEAIRRAPAGASCAELAALLLEEVRRFEGPHHRFDDITLLLARYVDGAPPAPPVVP